MSTQLTTGLYSICVQRILHGLHRAFPSTLERFWSHGVQAVPPSSRKALEVFGFCVLVSCVLLKCQSVTTVVALHQQRELSSQGGDTECF